MFKANLVRPILIYANFSSSCQSIKGNGLSKKDGLFLHTDCDLSTSVWTDSVKREKSSAKALQTDTTEYNYYLVEDYSELAKQFLNCYI